MIHGDCFVVLLSVDSVLARRYENITLKNCFKLWGGAYVDFNDEYWRGNGEKIAKR